MAQHQHDSSSSSASFENVPTSGDTSEFGGTLASAAKSEKGKGDKRVTALDSTTVLEQMGGISGLVYSTVPIVVFIITNTLGGLSWGIWSAVGAAIAIFAWRLVRHQPLQPAVSGFIGVGISAFIAWRVGEGRGFFLWGIWISLVYGGVFLVSVLLRRPLVGVLWGFVNGSGQMWQKITGARRAYDIATICWAVVFLARYIVQRWLYNVDATGWLAAARLGMGWPLAALAFLVTVLMVRRAEKAVTAWADARLDPPAKTER